MQNFSGKYSVSIDKKGRFAFPVKHRNAIDEEHTDKIYLTRGRARCVFAFDKPRWEQFEQNIDNLELSYKEKELVIRAFIGHMIDVPMDSSGRITIPRELIVFGQLEDLEEVKLVGMNDKVEIWNPELFRDEAEKDEDKLQNIMDTKFVVRGSGTQRSTASGE
jgi:MraZ protein